jgi:hypothetical protein
MGRHARRVLCLLVALAFAAGPVPARALGACTSKKVVTVSVAAPTTNPVGNFPSCVPDMSCPNAGGCLIKLRGSVIGAGLVSLEMLAEGLSQPVACGPAIRGCEAESGVFFVPFGSVRALCQTKIAVAVNVQITCNPVFA